MSDKSPDAASPFDVQTQSDITQVLANLAAPEIVTRLLDTLTGALDSENARMRYSVVGVLGKIRHVRAVDLLMRTAKRDSEAQIQVDATLALANIAVALPEVQAQVVDTLLDLLNTSPRTLVRRSAIQGLELLPQPRAVELLVAALRDSDSKISNLAAQALKKIDTPEARRILAEREKNLYESR